MGGGMEGERKQQATSLLNGSTTATPTGVTRPLPASRTLKDSSDSEDDAPLASRMAVKPATASVKVVARPVPPKPQSRPAAMDDAVELPRAAKPAKPAVNPAPPTWDSDSDEDVPLSVRRISLGGSQPVPAVRSEAPAAKKRPPSASDSRGGKSSAVKRSRSESVLSTRRQSDSSGPPQNGAEIKWTTLEHNGVMFPPDYEPHGVKMLYDGAPVTLTPEQEEVATFYAVMLDTDYLGKETFRRNFWEGFREVLGPRHVIQCLEKCDFRAIYDWHMAQREAKRGAGREEKAAAKAAREAAEAPYRVAVVDGKVESVGNFRVEPPGLFRGRGEHPRMGKIKRRIYPRDITLNLGPGCPVPAHPYAGQSWREVRRDRSVTWLAYWHDPVNPREYKYVFLAATSSWKAESDVAKYEKARRLKDVIDDIRAAYTAGWASRDVRERQMTTALYFIDRLALRAGHEKDEDEADTVGCCTLKVENVECVPPHSVKFDFLGKDSIRYENVVDVDARVYANVRDFCAADVRGAAKRGGDQLFDAFDAQDLNIRLKHLMDGLSVKVFRTYNASIVLDRLLARGVDAHGDDARRAGGAKKEEEEEEVPGADDVGPPPAADDTVDAKKAYYDRANKEVAILCNHQRAVPRGHEGQMDKIKDKLDALRAELAELQADLKRAAAGKPAKDGRKLNEDSLRNRVEKKELQIEKAEINAKVKEDLKTVALGTSKINYLDPRITVAWCKRNEVPMERVFNRSLYQKFAWAMDVEPGFRF